jgi:hypothetical protein
MMLMVVIAVIAVSFGFTVLWRRAAESRQLTKVHSHLGRSDNGHPKASTAEAVRKQAEMGKRRAER